MVKINKTLKKELRKTIKENIKRYISLVVIIFLGVFFYVGMKSNAPVLEKTMVKYFEKNNFEDIEVTSVIGITKKEIEKVRDNFPEIIDGEGVYYEDVISTVVNKNINKKNEVVIAVNSYNPSNKINKVEVFEGNDNIDTGECLADGELKYIGYNIGDKLKLKMQDNSFKEVTIKGFVNSPYYISIEKGNSLLLSGKINYFIYVPEDFFDFEDNLYTKAVFTLNTDYKAFTDEYDNYTADEKKKIKKYVDKIIKPRLDKIVKEKTQELNDGIEEYEKQKALANQELDNANNQIIDGENKIKDAESKIMSDREVDMFLVNAKSQLDMAKSQLDASKTTLDLAKKVLADMEKSPIASNETIRLPYLKSELEKLNKLLEDSNKLLSRLEKELQDNEKKCSIILEPKLKQKCNDTTNKIKVDITSTNNKVETLLYEISQIKKLITLLESNNSIDVNEYKGYIANLEREYNKGYNKYNKSLRDYNYAKYNMKKQMQEARTTIEEKKKELADAKKLYEEKKLEVNIKLDEAYQEITKGQKLLNSLSKSKSYVFSRIDSYGYSQYYDDTVRVESLAKILPIVFFLVAALVTGSSITRMAKEERGKIGVLKSLGYDSNQILYKYLLYTGSACLIGIVFGTVIGMFLFPKIFANVYTLLYFIPKVRYVFSIKYVLLATIFSVLATVVVAYFSVKSALNEKPSELFRAESGKIKKGLLMENKSKKWKNMPYMKKITFRNIFGSLKRSIMTILGVAGCTSIIIAGFGTRTSISNIIHLQFGNLFDISGEFFFKEELTNTEMIENIKEVDKLKFMDKTAFGRMEMVEFKTNKKTYSVYSMVPDNEKDFYDMIALNDMDNKKKKIDLPSDGVILTEKIAKLMDVKKGDYIEYTDPYEDVHKVKVSAIIENYVYHYMFMSKEYYESINEIKPINNMLLVKYKDGENVEKSNKVLMDTKKFSNYISLDDVEFAYSQVVDKFNRILIVIIISAGMLAFVVLYNLAKINISERLREIATLKVLGFNTKEVNKFINSEINILTVIGIIVGCFIGAVLTELVITTCELDTIMFDHSLDILSYIYAIILTIIFSKVIDFIIKKDLRKIKMIESLKSREE